VSWFSSKVFSLQTNTVKKKQMLYILDKKLFNFYCGCSSEASVQLVSHQLPHEGVRFFTFDAGVCFAVNYGVLHKQFI